MYKRHPLSSAFPSMSDDEQSSLTEDIKQHGQRERITLYQDQVLDGWHRLQACSTLGIECYVTELPDNVDPVAFVISHNMHRRHLTPTQRTAAILLCNSWAETGRPQKGVPSTPLITVAEVAKLADVSESTVHHAKTAIKAGLGDKLRDGELSAKKAAEIVKPKVEPPLIIKPEPEQPQSEMVTIEKEQLEEMKRMITESHEEEQALITLLDSEPDDRLKVATGQIKQLVEQVRLLKMSLDGANNRVNEYISIVKSKDRQITKLEKELAGFKIDEVGL